jgi:DNA-binding transcriptional ArsR family regulator
MGVRMPSRNGTGIELLADPTRRAIVALIAVGIRRPAQIAHAIGLGRPATSRQLGILVRAGLIRSTWSRVDHRGRVYAIHPQVIGPVLAWLAGVEIGRRIGDDGWSVPRWPAGSGRVVERVVDSNADDDGSG